MDDDLRTMTREQPIVEARRLRDGIRQSLDDQLPNAPRSDEPSRR